jgi:glycosyltransferase involved in cell wall biosynthesis
MASRKLCVLVPCYNESKNISSLLSLSKSLVSQTPEIDFTFCFIENGSTDDTHQVLEESCKSVGSELRIQLIKIPQNLGLGFGLISGLKVFPQTNVCIIPADGKYEASEISKIIE